MRVCPSHFHLEVGKIRIKWQSRLLLIIVGYRISCDDGRGGGDGVAVQADQRNRLLPDATSPRLDGLLQRHSL